MSVAFAQECRQSVYYCPSVDVLHIRCTARSWLLRMFPHQFSNFIRLIDVTYSFCKHKWHESHPFQLRFLCASDGRLDGRSKLGVTGQTGGTQTRAANGSTPKRQWGG